MTKPEMTQPTSLLRGERIRLTALGKEDLPSVARWQHNSEFLRFYDALPAYPKNQAALEQWLEERQKEKDVYLFGVRPLDENTLLGFVEIDGILWPHQVGWLSIAIGDPAHWGRGFGTEAMQLLLTFAFDELNLHRVQLTVFSYNERAIALYEKIGFQREGTFREFLRRDGLRHDMHLYGLLRREWRTE